MLTACQKRLLDHIVDYQAASGGVSPTFNEMCAGVGLASKSGIFRTLEKLEERGYIRRCSHRHRAIEVIKPSRPAVPLVSYPDAAYFIVERDELHGAYLVPLETKKAP